MIVLAVVLFNLQVPKTIMDLTRPISNANSFFAMLMLGMTFKPSKNPEYLKETAQIVLYRLCMIPMIIVMATAFFYIHGGSVANGELAFSYLLLFILMYIAGPGRYSVDAIISYHLNKDEDDDEF